MQHDQYNLLISKLDAFIRKYYLNKLLRGLLICSAAILGGYLFVSLTEYWAYLPGGGRMALSVLFIAGTLAALAWLVALPLFRYFRIGKLISHEEAAMIIGRHFKDVEDRLLNILQLRSDLDKNQENRLIAASIEQKTQQIKLVPFSNAVDLRENRRYLRYLIPPVLCVLFLLLASPDILRESNHRLAHPNKEFEKPAPFDFVPVNLPSSGIQYADIPVELKMEGDVLPERVNILVNGVPSEMQKKDAATFDFMVANPREDLSIQFEAGKFRSVEYDIKILPKPLLSGFEAALDYPSYTGLKNRKLEDVGDIAVPAGTKITWTVKCLQTEDITFRFNNEYQEADPAGKSRFRVERTLMEDTRYTMYSSNSHAQRADSLTFRIQVIPDEFPLISVEQGIDSSDSRFYYFLGEAMDDHGFSRLAFRAERYDAQGARDSAMTEDLDFSKTSSAFQFSHFMDIRKFRLAPGEKIDYFFELWDNDAVSGPKSVRSSIYTYQMPTVREFQEIEEQKNEAIKDRLEKSLDEMDVLSQDIEKLKERLLSKKALEWEDKKAVESLLKEHEQLKEELEKIQSDFTENKKQQDDFKEVDEEIREKQEKLEELMDELLTEEMKEMLDKLEKLMEEFMDQSAFEELENFEMNSEELENELDRMLELFKQLEFEQKLSETLDKLEELAEEQMKLSEESLEKDTEAEEISKEQEKLNEEFEDLQKDLGKLDELNEELQDKFDLEGNEEEGEEIRELMEQSKEQLDQNQKKKAGPTQQDAGQKMKKMAQKMGQMMESMQMAQHQENIEHLRQLLENLVQLSFDQENLIEEVKRTETTSPMYVILLQDQYKLQEDSRLIEDSLVALSKRVFQLESFITDEIYKVNREMDQSIDHLVERRKGQATVSQQYVMTSVNNLALMLSEVMEQMQQSMASSMSGSQNCQKPGGGKPSPSLQKMQEQLNQQMKQMQQSIQQGESGKGGRKLSRDFAEMAARQAAIREALRKMKEGMSQQEKDASGVDELMDAMDQTETDLVNKQLTEEMLKRQEQILDRLLDFETAQREQGKEEKRESRTADQPVQKMPPALEEYLKKRQADLDKYKTVPPSLLPFYKQLVEKYYDIVN